MQERRSRPENWLALVAMAPLLAGCGSLLGAGTETAAGVVGAGVATAATSNATIAAGIGLGVSAGGTPRPPSPDRGLRARLRPT